MMKTFERRMGLCLGLVQSQKWVAFSRIELLNQSSDLHTQVVEHGGAHFESSDCSSRVGHLY